MMHTLPVKWDSQPDHQPCWSIWAPAPVPKVKQQQKDESRFWPRYTPPTTTGYLHSPPLSPSTETAGQISLHTPPQSPQALPSYSSVPFTPLLADRSYLINCTGPLFIVQFKGNRFEVFTGAKGVEHYENELVIVEADRGQDLGRIFKVNVSYDYAGQLKLKQHEERTAILNACGSKEPATAASPHTPNNILRSATNDEINQLTQKLADERKAVAFCCQKVRERGLDMQVLDAEFQWDRRKLTFFYKAGHRIDFRDLVRELFRTYKTRIWMCAVASD